MADISKFVFGENEWNIKDSDARERIAALESYTDYLGVTTTELTDGATTNPITVNGEAVTAVKGSIANYGSKEFIFNSTAWQEFGDLSGLGALAFKNNATGDFTPQGTISQPTTTVNTTSTTINSITDVGTLPTFTVSGETLTFSAGTLPAKGSDTTVVASITDVTTTQPTFTGTQGSVTVS